MQTTETGEEYGCVPVLRHPGSKTRRDVQIGRDVRCECVDDVPGEKIKCETALVGDHAQMRKSIRRSKICGVEKKKPRGLCLARASLCLAVV